MSRATLPIVAGLLVVTLAAMALVAAQRARLQHVTAQRPVVPAATPRPAAPRRSAPVARAPAPAARTATPGFGLASVRAGHAVAFRSAPGGARAGRLDATTEFGSPQTLSVAATSGPWLGVTTSALPNGKLGWVNAHAAGVGRLRRTTLWLRVRLSRRLLELRQGSRLVRAMRVGVGRPTSPTPRGRFAVTDKLDGGAYGPYYGCCILALSGHQTNTPPGWPGGDRLAIHGTDDAASIGGAASAGCLHADAWDLRLLMRRVPLGTPVFIGA